MKYEIEEALAEAKSSSDMLSKEQKISLEEKGFCLIYPNNIRWEKFKIDLEVAKNRIQDLIDIEGTEGGWDHKSFEKISGKHAEPGSQRVSNLMSKDFYFRNFFMIPEVLAATHYIVKDKFKLSSLSFREPLPNMGKQKLHIDWRPRHYHNTPFDVVVAYVYLDNSTKENGCLRIVPGSHKWLGEPKDYKWDSQKDHPDQILVEAPKGSIAVFNAHAWHGGTKNISGERRRSISLVYRNRRLFQQLDQKSFILNNIQSRLTRAEKYFLAIRPEDPPQSQFWYKRRNKLYIQKLAGLAEFINHYSIKLSGKRQF